MRTQQRQKSPFTRWQKLVLFVTIFMLAVSALPNLYMPTTGLTLTPVEQSSAQQPDLTQLQQALQEAKIDTQSIKQNEDGAAIVISSALELEQAKSALSSAFPQSTVAIADISTMPPWLANLGLSPIKLGLDLKGGVLFVLQVDTDTALEEYTQNMATSAKSLIRENRLYGTKVTQKGNELTITHKQSIDKVIDALSNSYGELTTNNDQGVTTVSLSENNRQQVKKNIMEETLTTMRDRIEQLGITEAGVQRQGAEGIRIEIPGIKDPEQAKKIIGATASLAFYQTTDRSGQAFYDRQGNKVSVKQQAIFTGANIKHAQAGRDDRGIPMVSLILDDAGGKKMQKFTKDNIGQLMASVFSEYYQNKNGDAVKSSRVISVAQIQGQLGSRFSITNLDSMEQAQELAMYIRAGSLSAPVTIDRQRTIGPTLGAENIQNGLAALMLGIGITLFFMGAWYRKLGLVANVALAVNLTCLLGVMTLLPGAVLTLPGIAGIVLTVGMAVDTNVLIFERIKEEFAKGKSRMLAIEQGFSNALSSIVDANLTTFLTAIILYSIGTGAVKGFALTLSLGIFTSLLTGVFLSKYLVTTFYANGKPQTAHKQEKLNDNNSTGANA